MSWFNTAVLNASDAVGRPIFFFGLVNARFHRFS
jgi:hypothetical protein